MFRHKLGPKVSSSGSVDQTQPKADRDMDGDVDWDDSEFDWLLPPRDVHDVAGWDRYWTEQVQHGLGPPLFDMFVYGHEDAIVEAMRQRGLRTVLCAGNGMSLEPRALASAGAEVVALDVSRVGLEIAESFPAPDEALASYFRTPRTRPGGSISVVVGDLADATVCPGPFDVVIERRTLQLFEEEERLRLLEGLLGRLRINGLFVSQQHNGAWRPGDPSVHWARPWLEQRGFDLDGWAVGAARRSSRRLALLSYTTG
jgi:hypothetical protein